jgi:hypothetical protein
MTYEIEIIKRVVTYYGSDGAWLDGSHVELETPDTETLEYDAAEDAEEHGSPIGWAVDMLDRTDVVEASMWPITDQVQEHNWLHGTYADPYQGPGRHDTETTARLIGDWTPEERAQVFRAAVRTDQHGV